MKQEYTTPEIDIIHFSIDDVITASGNQDFFEPENRDVFGEKFDDIFDK